MATVFRLANYAQGTTVDLHAGTLKLEAESWSTRTAPMEGSYKYSKFGAQPKFDHLGVMVENFGLIGDDTVGNLITGHNNIMACIEKARLYHEDPLQSESWWLEANANGESAKRALLYEGSLQALTGVGLDPLMATKKLRLGCSLSRHPLWESVAATTVTTETEISLTGGMWAPTTVPDGSAPGRIGTLSLGPIINNITRLWCGIRPALGGTAGFTALQECETGIEVTDAVDTAGGAGDSGGRFVLVSFATATAMTMRLRKTVSMMGGTAAHFRGRYIVLLRCKVSAGTVAVQLRYGMPGSLADYSVANQSVYVTNTDYQLVDLGEIQIPPYGMREGLSTAFGAAQLEFWAERVVGVGTLTLDAFILMPTDSFAYWDELPAAAIEQEMATAYTLPDDSSVGMCLGEVTPVSITNWMVRNLYWPVGGGVMVMAGQGASAHALGETTHPSVTVFPRWYNFRG